MKVVQKFVKIFLTKCEHITVLMLLTTKIFYIVTIKSKLIFEGRNYLCLTIS